MGHAWLAAFLLLGVPHPIPALAQPVAALPALHVVPLPSVYVSSSEGNDANWGHSPQAPKRTIAAAYPLVRPHGALLLKAGDVFPETLTIRRPGTVATYGGTTRAIFSPPGGESAIQGFGELHDVTLYGLEFRTEGYTGWPKRTAVFIVGPGSDLRVEECYFRGWANGLVVQGFTADRTGTVIARNVFHGQWTSDPNNGGTGLFTSECPGADISHNVIIGPSLPGRYLSHGAYVNSPSTLRWNYASRGGRSNFSLRGGGEAWWNFSADGAQGICMGLPGAEMVKGEIVSNVVQGGANNSNGQPLGVGISLARCDVDVIGNLVAYAGGSDPYAFTVYPGTTAFIDQTVIHNWHPPYNISPEATVTYGHNVVTSGDPSRTLHLWLESRAMARAVGVAPLVRESVNWELTRFGL